MHSPSISTPEVVEPPEPKPTIKPSVASAEAQRRAQDRAAQMHGLAASIRTWKPNATGYGGLTTIDDSNYPFGGGGNTVLG